jgi:uridine monophosphate synthetase
MSFFVKLTDAIASHQSLLIAGLDPNPEMLESWNRQRGSSTGSFLSQARRWLKAVINATDEHICAYKPSLGFYQALGPTGLELLHEVRDLVPRSIPLIVDCKHGDLNSSSALAHYLFEELGADAVTLSPLPGQDIAAPFLLHGDKGVVVTCHSSNPASRVVQHYPNASQPLYLELVREAQRWGTPEQVLLEIGTSEPEILARVRQAAPSRFVILRSLWAEEQRLEALLRAGLTPAGDGLLLPLPQNLLVGEDIGAQALQLKQTVNDMRQAQAGPHQPDTCALWLPPPLEAPADRSQPPSDNLDALIVDLFDIGCLLFGDYVQASGAVFNYYIDLRQIISDPNLFHRVLHAYGERMQGLLFDRIAGIPYGSLPTATGLSLQLKKPLIYPRKEVKAHGARRLIEGDFNPGDTAVVVDDILITGGSVLEGIAKLEGSGLVVRDVVVFIDHGGSARQWLADAGYRTHAVLELAQITRALRQAGRLTAEQAVSLGSHQS